MDDRWESEVIEYGAINITGFRIVDATRPHVKDFLAGWHRLDPATSQGAGRESISVCICSRISSASPARPSRHFFSRLSSVDGFSTLSRLASRGETTLRAKSSECLPSASRFPPGGSNIFLGFFVFLEYPSPTDNEWRWRRYESFARETRIKQESPDPRIRSHARSQLVRSLCAFVCTVAWDQTC